VVVDGARAQEQLCGDLAVGEAVRDKPGDLPFSRGEPGSGERVGLAGGLAGGRQLGLGAVGPRNRAQPLEQLQRRMQVGARVAAPALPPQPLAVQQVGAGPLQRRQRRCAADRLAEGLIRVAFAEQGLCPGRRRARADRCIPADTAAAGLGGTGWLRRSRSW